jgi:hypothetical protein
VSRSPLLGRPVFAVIALSGAAALFAGCAGSQPSGVTPQTSLQVPTQSRVPLLPDAKCSHQGNVKVKPCSVTLTTSNPSTTVTVKAPKKDTVMEQDNCGGATGVATVAQVEGSTWSVTAGATSGSCAATFTSTNKKGKQKGSATLSITNSV